MTPKRGDPLNVSGLSKIDLKEIALLERALAMAEKAHRGRVDRRGEAHILHVYRVVNRVDTLGKKIVAALHDVVSYQQASLKDLNMFFPAHLTRAVDALSKRKDESNGAYVTRLKKDPLARAVKIADLEDMLETLEASPALSTDGTARLQRYREALEYLTST